MSWRLRALNAGARLVARRRLRRAQKAVELRASFDRATRTVLRVPPHTVLLEDDLGGVPSLWIGPADPAPRAAVLYLHGGAYVAGSPRTHAGMLARLGHGAGMRVVAPDYRLAPENPFPAAVEDAEAAWDALVERGYPPSQIVIGGDSAGGGLALSLLSRLCLRGEMPAGAFAFSPWTDLTLSGLETNPNSASDPVIPAERVADAVAAYLKGADPADPRASPVFAEFPDCPPVLIQASDTELLHDDAARVAERIRSQGGYVRLETYKDVPHVWQMFDRWIPEAREAMGSAARFVAGCCALRLHR